MDLENNEKFKSNNMKVILMIAATLDGKIAKDSHHFPNWTSSEDKKLFSEISKRSGVVLMGDKTFFTLKKPLKDRLNVVFTLEENPPFQAGVRWVKGDPQKVLVILEEEGYKEVILGGGATLNGFFLRRKLIDEIILTIEPKIFGHGISLFEGKFKPNFEIDLELLKVKKLNQNSLALFYKVKY